MDYIINDSQAEELIFAANTIYRIVGFAKGQADRYIARRNEIQVLQFSDFAKKKPNRAKRRRKQILGEMKKQF